jgi:hypothetical protein
MTHAGDDTVSTKNRVLVDGFRLGRLRVDFEKTNWPAFFRQTGALKLRKQGDAAESEEWTCLTIVRGQMRFQIWLDSDELGGGSISGVTAYTGVHWPLSECPIKDPGPGPIGLGNGLWIATTKSDIISRLGQPTAVHGAALIYDFEADVRDPKLGEGATSGRLIFEIHSGRTTRLSATRGTSF